MSWFFIVLIRSQPLNRLLVEVCSGVGILSPWFVKGSFGGKNASAALPCGGGCTTKCGFGGRGPSREGYVLRLLDDWAAAPGASYHYWWCLRVLSVNERSGRGFCAGLGM